MDDSLESQLLYAVEHQFLPQALFDEDADKMIVSILRGKGGFFPFLLELMGREQGYVCPYAPEEFKVEPQIFRSEPGGPGVAMVEITFPEPVSPPLCRRAFICHDEDMGQVRYFTVEKSLFGPDMLCSWDAERTHHNYGSAPETEREQIARVLELYLDELDRGTEQTGD
ncbi:MAG: hypothetical protein IK095_07905 [Oscillospiraceae bacterium]|nr:hypothetical protein [Oscillospiraceae bacterium]